jgi:hypothetical protein
MCAFSALLPELGFPLEDGRDAAGCHRVDDLFVGWDGAKGAAQEQFKWWIDR